MTYDLSFIDGGLSNMALGDSIVAASMFCHLGKVRWFLKDGDLTDKWTWNRVHELYKDQFELEMIFEKPASVRQVHPWALFGQNNMRVVKPNQLVIEGRGNHCTTQFAGNFGFRYIDPIHREGLIERHAEGLETISQDRSKVSLKELFETVGSAQFHLGCNSGIMWVAAAMGTPTKLIVTDHPANDNQDKHYKRIIENHSDLITKIETVPMAPGVDWMCLKKQGLDLQ